MSRLERPWVTAELQKFLNVLNSIQRIVFDKFNIRVYKMTFRAIQIYRAQHVMQQELLTTTLVNH